MARQSKGSLHARWWERRIARQNEIDASIAANADYEYLYDKPYEDRGKVRVAGPFTVESISPYRVLGVDENGDIIAESSNGYASEYDFAHVMLENLRTVWCPTGAHGRQDRILVRHPSGQGGWYAPMVSTWRVTRRMASSAVPQSS